MAILVLSLILLLGLLADTFLLLSAEMRQLFQLFDTLICIIFLGDFCIRFIVPNTGYTS